MRIRRVLGNQLLKRSEPGLHPVLVPGVDLALVMPQWFFEVVEDAQVVERVHLAGNQLAQLPDSCGFQRILRDERIFRRKRVEVLDDRQRLGQHGSVVQHERRNQSLRIESEKSGVALLALAQVDRAAFDLQAFESQGNADSEPRRGSEVVEEKHRGLFGRRLKNRGSLSLF